LRHAHYEEKRRTNLSKLSELITRQDKASLPVHEIHLHSELISNRQLARKLIDREIASRVIKLKSKVHE